MKINKILLLFECCFLTLIFINPYTVQGQKYKAFTIEKDKFDREELRNKYLVVGSNSFIDTLLLQYKSLSINDSKYELLERMGHVQNNRIVEFLENILLTTKSIQEKRIVCQSLENLRSKNSIPVLISTLNDSSNLVTISASLALLSLGDTSCLKKFRALCYNQNSSFCYSCNHGFLVAENQESIKFFNYALVNSSDVYCRVEAAINLAILKQPNTAIPSLTLFLQNTNPNVRMAAIRGFAYVGDDISLKIIREMLKDPDTKVVNYTKRILNGLNKGNHE